MGTGGLGQGDREEAEQRGCVQQGISPLERVRRGRCRSAPPHISRIRLCMVLGVSSPHTTHLVAQPGKTPACTSLVSSSDPAEKHLCTTTSWLGYLYSF